MIYLDDTAVAKLMTAQPETHPLREYLADWAEDRWFTSALTRVHLTRTQPQTPADRIHTAMTSLDTVAITERLLDAAARIPAHTELDHALHIAAAQTAGTRLRTFITYNPARIAAARAAKLPVAHPGAAC